MTPSKQQSNIIGFSILLIWNLIILLCYSVGESLYVQTKQLSEDANSMKKKLDKKRANERYRQKCKNDKEQLHDANRSDYQKSHISICQKKKACYYSNADSFCKRSK